MGSIEGKYSYEAVPGVFAQELPATDATTFDYAKSNLGPIARSYESDGAERGHLTQWARLEDYVHHLNSTAPPGTSFKLIINGRHGQGDHNVAETLYGTKAWDDHWSKLDGTDTVNWSDAHLTETGKQQAIDAGKFLRQAFTQDKLPAPERYYISPLYRCLQTASLTYSDIELPEDRPFKPLVKEMLREAMGEHTCDRRSTRTVIQDAFPHCDIEEGFKEHDVLWQAEHRETHDEHDVRTRALLDDVFANDPSEVLSFTSHSGSIASLLRVVGHRVFRLQTGALIPVLVKATRLA